MAKNHSIQVSRKSQTSPEPGSVFTRWTVIDYSGRNRAGHKMYQCRCQCGTVKDVVIYDLIRGASKSCGCLSVDFHTNRLTTHNLYRSPEYNSWAAMKQRCLNHHADNFKFYGGRGVSVCDRWLSFENFYSDMGPKPSSEYTIERIDNLGNYEPSNCKWADKKEQGANKISCYYITYDGVTDTITGWSRRLGLCEGAISQRIRRGMNPVEALTCEKRTDEKPFAVFNVVTNQRIGIWKTQAQCDRDIGINRRLISGVLSGRCKTTHGYKMEYI
jgi:hypothetical protein